MDWVWTCAIIWAANWTVVEEMKRKEKKQEKNIEYKNNH